jgi:hypothetical protein
MRPRIDPRDIVFNVVWTGTVFSALRRFTDTVMTHEPCRFRFIANACPPSEVDALHAYAAAHADRVVEVTVASTGAMLRHGDCLDQVLGSTDDGPLFSLLDPDILATGPFLAPFIDQLDHHDAVTSGTELWSEDNIRPDGHIGVNGEIFYDRDGYVFGSPHLAIYRAGPLRATIRRWGAGFSSAGNDISDEARARLDELGRSYWIYDTGKIVNILLQGDGGPLVHLESEEIVHVGGLAHFLSPPQPSEGAAGLGSNWGNTDRWNEWENQGDRFFVASQAARHLHAEASGQPLPPLPTDIAPSMVTRLARLRSALETLPPLTDDDRAESA